ncbi:transcriptional coactivator/pterin dehydratase [Biscogniauxia marginata]|nr:transcriptional coactivator/pterin dehydratase [Biscogniauxia marginata]
MHTRLACSLLRCLSASTTSTSCELALRVPRCTWRITSSYRALACQHPRRSFTSTLPLAMASSTTARFSPGVDETALSKALEPLLVAAGQAGGRWTLTPDGEGLERSFKFKTFAKTWDFMTAVSLQCKLKNHHPEWSNVYNTTYIRWTTHNPKGLSAKDVELAAICDGLARDFGEIAEDPEPTAGSDVGSGGGGVSCNLRQVADRAVANAGADCCTPPKK